MTLAELVAARLERAGFAWDDPALVQLREWNRQALERSAYRVETRRGQFGQTRLVESSSAETAKP